MCSGQATQSKPQVSITSKGNNNVIVGVNQGTINVQSSGSGYPGLKESRRIRGAVALVELSVDPSARLPDQLSKIPEEFAGLRNGRMLIGNAVLINDGDFLTAGAVGAYAVKAEKQLKDLGITVRTVIGLVGANGQDKVGTTRFDIAYMSVREIWVADKIDLALLRTKHASGLSTRLNGHTNYYEHSPFRLSKMEFAAGEDILSCGFPNGTDMSFTKGLIGSDSEFQSFSGAEAFKVYKVELGEYPAYIAGGPVIRKSDRALIGLLVGRDGKEGRAVAVPAGKIEEFLTFNKIKWTGLENKPVRHASVQTK
jgi:hypothetical protein